MIKLLEQGAFDGVLPIECQGTRLRGLDLGPIWAILPKPGQGAAASEALSATHGLPFPAPGTSARVGGIEALWFGRDQALLIGAVPSEALHATCAVIDQSDGWAVADLDGDLAEPALARLVPIDLDARVFGIGQTARTQAGHMALSITRTGPQAFRLMVFRSMAQTLVHELSGAMTRVAARG